MFFWSKQSADGLSRPHLDFSNHLDQTTDPQFEDDESRDLIWWRGGRGWNGTLWPDLATGAPPPPSSNQKYWVGQVCRPHCRCTKIPLNILETQQHTLGTNSVTMIRDWSVFIGQQTFCQDGRFVRKTFCQDRPRRFVRKTFCQDRLRRFVRTDLP